MEFFLVVGMIAKCSVAGERGYRCSLTRICAKILGDPHRDTYSSPLPVSLNYPFFQELSHKPLKHLLLGLSPILWQPRWSTDLFKVSELCRSYFEVSLLVICGLIFPGRKGLCVSLCVSPCVKLSDSQPAIWLFPMERIRFVCCVQILLFFAKALIHVTRF